MARRVRRGVKARRVVRRFELWSVAKLALVFHLFFYFLTVAVLVVLWNVAFKLGTITKLETFLSDFGFSDKATKQDFRLHGDAIFRAGTMAGLGLVALNTLVTVMLAFFYNGVSGLFGGIVVSVLEERPPLSPAERRAVAADGRGERLALPSGGASSGSASSGGASSSAQVVDGKRLSRRERRKQEQIAEAASKAEAAAVRLATEPVVPTGAASSKHRRKRAPTGPASGSTPGPATGLAGSGESNAAGLGVGTSATSTSDAKAAEAPSIRPPAAAKTKPKTKSRNGTTAAKRGARDLRSADGREVAPALRTIEVSEASLAESLPNEVGPVDMDDVAEVAAGVPGPSGQ